MMKKLELLTVVLLMNVGVLILSVWSEDCQAREPVELPEIQKAQEGPKIVPPELQHLRSLAGGSAVPGQELREKAQRETALGLGIQAGTRWRYQEIMEKVVEPWAGRMDGLFDFSSLVFHDGPLMVLPPVITEAGAAVRLAEDTLTSQRASYRLVRGARLITTLPHWRSYLDLPLKEPEEIHEALLPRGAELAAWRKDVDQGWALGLEQAESLFENRMARLVRDYTGLLRYHRLRHQNLVAAPEVYREMSPELSSETDLVFEHGQYQLKSYGRFTDRKERKGTALSPVLVKDR